MRLILCALFLLLLGFVLSFLMVLRMIEPSFPIAFAAHSASFCGLVLGVVGALTIFRRPPRRGRTPTEAS